MKSLFSLILLFTLTSVFALSNNQSNKALKQCLETCLDYEEPGYGLRKCASKCREDLGHSGKSFCTSFEDFCDDDDDVWGGL